MTNITWLTSGYVRCGVRLITPGYYQVVFTQGQHFGVQGGYYATEEEASHMAYCHGNS